MLSNLATVLKELDQREKKERMNLGILRPKLFPALVCSCSLPRCTACAPRPPCATSPSILAVMLARDILYVVVPDLHIYLLTDLAIIVLYVLWLRSFTGWRRFDTVFVVVLDAAACAVAVVNIFFPVVSESDFS